MKTCAREGCDNTVRFPFKKFCSGKCRRRDERERYARDQGRTMKPYAPNKKRLCADCGCDISHRGHGAVRCEEHARKRKVKLINQQEGKQYSQEAALRDIAKLREELGLKPLEPATIPCDQCGCDFDSWDIHKNRHCDKCLTKFQRLNNGAVW